MASKLANRKSKLVFVTADEIRERGKYRAVIVEAHPGYATLRLQGLRKSFTLPYGAIYGLAVKAAVAAERAEKAAKKKGRGN